MKKISFIGILLIVLLLPIVSAHEEKVIDPGVTPDSFLWGLDKALDNLNLLFTFNPAEKARKGIEIARERLEEVKVMVEENKLEDATKSKDEQVKVLSKVKKSISDIKEENATKQIEEEIEIEKELEEHEQEVKEVSDNLKIKIEVKGTLSEEQKALIDSLLSALENKITEVKIEIIIKKDKTKIEIKQKTGKSEKEIEDEIEDIEKEKGLADIKKEKFAEKIEDDKEDLAELEKELQEHKAEGHIADETPITTLIDNAKERLSNAEEAFKNNKLFEAFAQRNVAMLLIKNAEGILKKAVEKFEEEEEAKKEREIEVEIEKIEAKIKVKIGDAKLKFAIHSTDKNVIIQEIAARTGLSIEEVTKLAEFEEKEEAEVEEDRDEKETCEIGGGTWREFPNSGKFCHDECNKPEKYSCKKFMSMGCDCGDDKCWNGKSCEIEEKGKGKETKLCKVGGCSGQLCGEASFIDNVVTICIWKEEYTCYQEHGKCEVQSNGKCGWTQTEELLKCLEEKGKKEEKKVKVEDKESCEAQGGKWGMHGLSLEESCLLPTSDAGKECSDSDECEGDCIAELSADDKKNLSEGGVVYTNGKCSEWKRTYGCHAFVNDGKVQSILCKD